MPKTRQVNIRLDEDLHRRIAELAEREDRRFSDMVRVIVQRYFRDAAAGRQIRRRRRRVNPALH